MSDRPSFNWVWIALIAFASSAAGSLAVWLLVIAPQLDKPPDQQRLEQQCKLMLNALQTRMDQAAAQQLSQQRLQFDEGLRRIEGELGRRINGAVERAAREKLSDAFLASLREQIVDQATQAERTADQGVKTTAKQAATELETMLRRELGMLNPAKVSIVESWVSMRQLPESNEAAGLNPPEAFASTLVRSVEVGKGGAITARLDARLAGDDAQVVLTPQVPSAENGPFIWLCATNVAAVLKVMPVCELRSRKVD